ncbi:TetR/AcrR family transcriptional regulator [Paraburkholderia sp. J76]|uniref:TetR/AcrR family transcriptional regulator n=1 Tax=Paraburkholderia sp. J76 TaxID=2805439 RepID=UPI002ABE3264|nr:TetR/AcrR family transcriptional regulator [Paraburkholderia sp. J76]
MEHVPGTATKDRLIATAIPLFARHGVEGVSVRMLNKEAGVSSQNAVYQHFGDMWGLMEAALTLTLSEIREGVEGLLDGAESSDADPLPLSEVVQAIVRPITRIAVSKSGMERLQFIARMIGGSGPRGKEVVAREWRSVALRVNELVYRALPENGREAAGVKTLFAFNTAINVVADMGLEAYWPLETKSIKRIDHYLLDYIEGGIRFTSNPKT